MEAARAGGGRQLGVAIPSESTCHGPYGGRRQSRGSYAKVFRGDVEQCSRGCLRRLRDRLGDLCREFWVGPFDASESVEAVKCCCLVRRKGGTNGA